MTDDLLQAWEFPAGFDLAGMVEISRAGLTPPDIRGKLVSTRGDVLTLQIAEGELTPGAEFLLYVGGRGAFQVLRREVWPGGRILLTLQAWRRT